MKNSLLLLLFTSMITFSNCDSAVVDAIFIDVRGNVSSAGEPVAGAIVLLVEGTDITNGLSLSNGAISNSSGDYTILKPKKGKYYVIAIDDVNNNFKYDSGTDRLGFYGVDSDNLDFSPNRITIGTEDIEGINIIDFTALPL